MDSITKRDLRDLLAFDEHPTLSIYMPTHRAGVETLQDPIRLKNLLRHAEPRLRAAGIEDADLRRWLRPLRALVDDFDFWQHQSDGLALFRSKDSFRLYRIPVPSPEIVVVGSRFHLKPLLAMFTGDSHFYVLALSQNQVRLFRATRDSIHEIEATNLPRTLFEALQTDVPQPYLQRHAVGTANAGGVVGELHGAGGVEVNKKEMLAEFFHRVDRGMHDLLVRDPGPVVLAAVDYLQPIYRSINSNPQLVEGCVRGSPSHIPMSELHEKALEVVAPYFLRERRQAEEKYLELAHTPSASCKLERVLPAAHNGKVRLLFIPVENQVWGKFDPEQGRVVMHPEPKNGDQDLLNLAAIEAAVNGGIVYAVPAERIPGGGPLAAVFRY